jgi:hypothetical protein
LLGKTASKTESKLIGKSIHGASVQRPAMFGSLTGHSPVMLAEAAENINKAKALATATDDVVFDELVPLPAKIAKALKISTPATKFYESLKVNKSSLMKALGLSSEEYNQYAALALKISKEESCFGLSRKYKMYHLAESTRLGTKFLSAIRKYLSGEGFLSLGMTRFKISKAPAEEKALFKQFGITFEKNRSNILKPEQSAVATMIHLANMGKEYPDYLKSVGELMPDLSSSAVKQSLQNARRILFHDKLRPVAVRAVRSGQAVDVEALNKVGLTLNDLEDLKQYAKTVILSKDAFLAARWNGRAIVPFGEKSRYAFANLLNVAAQKGYVSNIDRTSRVLYS